MEAGLVEETEPDRLDPPRADTISGQQDYFGFAQNERHMLPDGRSWVDLAVLNEGQRRRYQNGTSRELKLKRNSGDAMLKMATGDDKYELLKVAIVGWNLQRNGSPVAFNPQTLEQFLSGANPKIIDDIEKRVRKMNPWLLSEMTVEQIDEEIASLQEMRAVRAEEEAGKATS